MKRTITAILSICAILALVSETSLSADRPAGRRKAPQAASEWSKPVDISPTKTGLNVDARIVTDGSGKKAYVIWEESMAGPKKIFFTTNEKGTWKPVESLTVYEIGEYPGPEINLDNDGNPIVVFQVRINRNYELVFRQRKNEKWGAAENLTKTPTGGSQSASILVDRKTNDFYVIWQDDFERPTEETVYWKGYLTYKEKGVGKWIYSGVIEEETGRCYFHVADIDGNGKAYVTYDNRAVGNKAIIYFSQNPTPKDHRQWTPPAKVSDFSYLPFSYSKMACDNSGNVYVTWTKQLEEGNIDIFFRKKINGVWSAIENLSNSQAVSYNQTIAVNKISGQVYVAWAEQQSGGSWDVYFREYDGKAWSTVKNMTQNASTSDYPTLFVDEIGGVHLVYSDNKSGDPHIYYMSKPGEGACFPPLNLAVASKATAGDPRKKDNTLTWEKNPYNKVLTLTNYKIYRKKADDPDTAYKLVGTVSEKIFQFKDPNLLAPQQHTYKVTAVAKGNKESSGSTPANDQAIMPPFFPPTNLAVTSALGSGIYKKDNTLTWRKNAQNRASEVAKYRIYRKKIEEDDTGYVLAGETGADTLSFKDAGLVNDQRYTYVAVSYSIYSHESARTAPVTDLKVYATAYPPGSPALSTRLDMAASTKVNVLNWQANSQNQGLPIKSYRIYRKAEDGASYALAGTVGAEIRRFNDYSLSTSVKYLYKLTAVPEWDIESGPTSVLSEARVFPPINIVLQPAVNNFLLYKEKINKLTWVRSSLNDAVTVASYKIYRRLSTAGESAFAVVATVSGSAAEYLDRKLALTDKFVYRVTAVDSQGNESGVSAEIGEY